MRASAPGKVLLAGEYAILDGWPAVVMAVDRRVEAVVTDTEQPLTPFLAALRDDVGPAIDRVRADSSALALNGHKLGLGSSAAVVVAAAAAAAGHTDVHAIAHRAHARAQGRKGARGSGADIAASVHGGILRVDKMVEGEPLAVTRLPPPPPFVLLWTGAPADTPELVVQTRGLRDRDPESHKAAMAALGRAALALAAALAAEDPRAVIAAIDEGASALEALAVRSGAPLVPPGFAGTRALAGRYGGAAKPTGAGGGDLLLAVFPDSDASAAFRAAATRQRMIPITASVDPNGVRLANSHG